MMKLSTMSNGSRRLDEGAGTPVAAAVLARWAHDPESLAIARYSGNFVFSFTDAGRRRFLRVADARERSRSFILAEVELLGWLAAAGINLAVPLPSRSGHLVETIDTGQGVFHGVVFPALAGGQRAIDALDLAGFEAWGAALGQLHAAFRRYDGATVNARGSWRDTLALIRDHIPADARSIHREAEELAVTLAALPVTPDTYGLIHFDFELDNLVWGERGIGMLDFDDCTHHWYAADIAFALRDLFDHGARVEDERVQTFLIGYAGYHSCDGAMLAALPLFSRLARLLSYARIMRSLDLPEDAGAPAWVTDLQTRLQHMADAYRAALDC